MTLLLVGLGLHANDFNSLMGVAKESWPEKRHVGVICNYALAESQVQDLANAAGPDVHITVVDTRIFDKIPSAARLLHSRQANFVVLMPNGGVVQDGTIGGTMAIHRLADLGMPTLATRPCAVDQGVLFAIGPETRGELLMGDRLVGVVKVLSAEVIPPRKTASQAPFQDGSPSNVTVVSAAD